MKIKVLLNPYANRWKARERVPAVKKALDAAGIDYDLTLTESPGEAIAAAEQAAREFDAVIAAGGDGTLNEVINGLVRASGDRPTIPFGVIPIGTGNDFSDMVKLPRSIDEAVQVIRGGHVRQIDLGQVNDRYFDNNCALAMEPLVTLENIRIKRISGSLRYFVALIKALIKLQAWQMRIEWDDGQMEGPIYLLSVCNGPRTGSMFHMAPGARVDDGLFDVVLAPEISKLQVIHVLMRLFGRSHLKHPDVMFFQTTRLQVESRPGTPIHADGEMITDSETSIRYQIHPGKLTLLVPAPAG